MDTENNTISKQIERLDLEGIQHICKHDSTEFAKYLESTDNSICGKYPIMLLLELIKQTQDNQKLKTELINYGQSSELIKDFDKSSVSYASIVTEVMGKN